jgi:integrase
MPHDVLVANPVERARRLLPIAAQCLPDAARGHGGESPALGRRHAWASHAAMNGVPLLVVAKNLGHGDTRVVEKHYGHLAPSFIADAIRAGAPRYRVKVDKRVVPQR